MIPDPCSFGTWLETDSVGTTTGMVVNTQLGATYPAAYTALYGNAQRWRLAYMGVTIYQDGPTLADQGTVAAAMIPTEPNIISVGGYNTVSGLNKMLKPGIKFNTPDAPSFDALTAMPNAYFGQSKHGIYMPLKLSTNHQQWHSDADTKQDVTGWTYAAGWTVPTAVVASGWPYPGLNSAFYDAATGNWTPQDRSYPCNENWGRICFANLGVTTRLVCYWRVGYELQCQPGSIYSPYLKLSPPYDRAAIDAYFAISRELKDAYPAEFNDWGKLWKVIKQVASVALPFISTLGPIGAAVGTLGGAAVGGVDGVINAVRKSKKAKPRKDIREVESAALKASIPMPSPPAIELRDKPSEAALERARDVVKVSDLAPTWVRSAGPMGPRSRVQIGEARMRKGPQQAPRRLAIQRANRAV